MVASTSLALSQTACSETEPKSYRIDFIDHSLRLRPPPATASSFSATIFHYAFFVTALPCSLRRRCIAAAVRYFDEAARGAAGDVRLLRHAPDDDCHLPGSHGRFTDGLKDSPLGQPYHRAARAGRSPCPQALLRHIKPFF